MGIRFTNLSTKPVVHAPPSISNNSIIYDVSTSSFDVTYISNRVKIYYIITLDGFSLSEVEPLDEPIPVTINLYKINNNTQVLVSKVIDEFNYTSELKSIYIDKLFKEAFISSSFDFTIVLEVICDEDIVLSVPSSIIIEGELYNPFKEKAIHETISNDYEVLGKANFDLFTLDLYYNLFNISTSSILPLSIGANYCYGSVGLFGENIRCNYEYRIILEEDYLELIDCINNSTFFHKMTSTEASRYDIVVEDESEIYVNLNNFSYLLKNGNVIDYYLKSNTRYELLVIGTGCHTELNVLVKKIYTDKGLITLNWMGSTLKDIESDLNRIRISYSNYSYITRIDYDKGRYLTFNYITRNNKKYLSSINYCDSFNPTQTEVVLKTINYNYNNDNRLVLLYDSLNNQGLSFDYNNGKLSCVKEVLYNTNEYLKQLSLTNHSNITKVTDEIGKETSYYLDFFGKCYMVIDDKGNMIEKEYQKNNLLSSTPSLTFNSNGIINTLDVIKNPCFIGNESSSDFEWTISNLSDGVFSKSIGVNGRSALRVINSSSNVITLTQDITNLDIIKGKTIKFSGYIRGNGQVNINLKVNNINNNYIVDARNIWDKIETPFVLILDSVSSVSVEIKISTGSNIRLCEFNVESMQESRLNHLENGDLDNNSLNSIKYWVIEDEESEYGIINHFNITSPIIDNPLNLLIKKEISLFNCSDKLRRFKQSVDISGGSGEQIIFSFFSRLNITSDEKVFIKIIVHYKSLGVKKYPFILSDNTNLHKFNTFSITTESIYDKVEVGIYYQGMKTVSFSCFGLFKCDDGTYYYYNEKNSLTEIASGVGLTEIERGENDLVKRYGDKTGSVYEYRYLNNGNIDSISDHDGTNIKYEYDSNSYLSKCVINTKNNKRSILEQINDSNGNPLYIKNYDGSVLAYEYDNRERVEKKNSSSGLVEHFTYDNKDYLINKKYDLNDNLINHDFIYDSSYNLNNISVTNGSNFSKTHNSWGEQLNIKQDNSSITSYSYLKQGNFYTGLIQNKTYLNGEYEFRYDNLLRLNNIRYNDDVIVNYEYDDNNNIINKVEGLETRNYKYDYSNKLIAVSDSHVNITYEYDNLEKVEQKTIKTGNDYLNYNYIYDYEYNEYSIGGYFSRLEHLNDNDFLLDGFNLKYSNNANLVYNRNLLMKDELLNKNLLRFDALNDYIKYDCTSINNRRSKIISDRSNFNYTEWVNEFKNKKEIYLLFKVDELVSNNDTLLLSFNRDNNQKVKLLFDGNGSLKVVFSSKPYNFSGLRIIKGEWNLVRIAIQNVFNENNELIKNKLYIHFNKYQTSIDITLYKFNISTINNIKLGNNDNTYNAFDILYLSIGNNISSRERLVGIYNDAYNYVFGLGVKKAKGVVYYNHSLYNDLDVIPLNGSLNSVKGLKPHYYTYSDSLYKLNKAKLFKLDKKKSNIDDSFTNKHIYGSFDLVSMDGASKSLLGYDFGLKNEGMISFWFKLDSSIERKVEGSRTLICVPTNTSSGNEVLIYFNNLYNTLFINYNGLNEAINTHITCLPDKWHLFTFNFNNSNVKVSIDDFEYNTNLSNTIDLSDLITYIGCSFISNAPCNELNGIIELLSYDNHYLPLIHSTLINAPSITHITSYDELDRVDKKEIINGNNRLVHKYNYYDEQNNESFIKVNNLPSLETLEDGTNIYYTYDNSFNITHKVEVNNDEILDNYFYKYDYLNRLIEEKKYYGNTFNYHKTYSYNEISDIREIIEYDSSSEPLRKSVYNYSNTVKGQLNNITLYLYEGSDRWSVDYVIPFVYTSDPFRPSSYNGNVLTWQCRRLTSFGSNSYTYNSEGIRTSKTTLNGTYNYYLEGNKIIKEIKPNNESVIYHYDEEGMLVGFNYNNNEYFYSRDLTGNINKIIDINGIVKVEYKYDAWGKVLSIIGDNTIKNINSFLYKGYYYDFETSIYYCNSRYYDPLVKRWISIDEVSYLDSDSATGINLWCYCNNNPVMYSDEDGCLVFSTIFTICVIIIAATTIAGGIIGGVSAGQCGENVGQGIIEGMINGAYIGGSIDLIIAGAFTTGLGPLSILGSSMITYGISTLSSFVEVSALQYMKSSDEGLSSSKTINNVIKAMSANREDIILGRVYLDPIIDNSIGGTKFFSKLLFLAKYCAHYKNGLSFLTEKAPGLGLFISYGATGYNVYKTIKNISNRDYGNSNWELY